MAVGRFGGQCVDNHTAAIFDRGGTRRVGPLMDLSYVDYGRLRDNTSEATVRIQGDACDKQKSFLAGVDAHRHELVIFRGRDRVWEGPIHRPTVRGSFAEFVAKDVTEYLFHWPLTREWSNAFPNVSTVTQRFKDIITYELMAQYTRIDQNGTPTLIKGWERLDPPINVLPFLDVRASANEASTSAVTDAFTMTIGDHLDAMARTGGIDYTAVGRAIHIWDTSRAIGRLGQWTEANFFNETNVTKYGSDHAQLAYTVGQDGLFGAALDSTNLDYYGPWTSVYTSYQEEGTEAPTQEALNSQARRNLSGRTPVPLEVRIPDNSSIILTDTLTINDLVPGVQVPLLARLNGVLIQQLQKIDSVRVIEKLGSESIQVTLSPATKPDSDEVGA